MPEIVIGGFYGYITEPAACRNIFTDELYENTQTISLDMEEGTCVFLKYIP